MGAANRGGLYQQQPLIVIGFKWVRSKQRGGGAETVLYGTCTPSLVGAHLSIIYDTIVVSLSVGNDQLQKHSHWANPEGPATKRNLVQVEWKSPFIFRNFSV